MGLFSRENRVVFYLTLTNATLNEVIFVENIVLIVLTVCPGTGAVVDPDSPGPAVMVVVGRVGGTHASSIVYKNTTSKHRTRSCKPFYRGGLKERILYLLFTPQTS